MIALSTKYRRTIELFVVWVVALHSVAMMACLTFAPRLVLEAGGFGAMEEVFFIRYLGILHIVVGVGYLMEYERYGQTSLIVLSKGCSVVFLAVTYAFWSASQLVLIALVADICMGLGMYLVSSWAQRRSVARPRPARAMAY